MTWDKLRLAGEHRRSKKGYKPWTTSNCHESVQMSGDESQENKEKGTFTTCQAVIVCGSQ